jgi:two-component system nitrate/nitrite response regulator NarL
MPQVSVPADLARVEDEFGREPAEPVVLAEIGRVMGSSVHPDEAIDKVAPMLRQLIPWDGVAISLVDSATGTLRILCSTGAPVSVWAVGASKTVQDQPVLGAVTSRSGLIDGRGSASSLILPLLWRDSAIGALLFTSKRADAYGDHHRAIGERVAAQMAGAIAHWDLIGQLRRQAHETAIVAQIGRVLGSAPSLAEALPDLAGHLRRLVPCGGLAIALLEGDRSTARTWRVDGTATRASESVESLIDSVVESVIRTGTSIQKSGQTQGMSMPVDGDGRMELPLWRTVLAVPLTVRNETIGAMILHSEAPDGFGPAGQAVSERVAEQIAGIVGNLRLKAELGREVGERQLFADLANIARQSTELQPFLEQAVRRMAGTIKFDRLLLTRADHFRDLEITVYTTDRDVGGVGRDSRSRLTGSITAEALRAGRGILLSITTESGLWRGSGLSIQQVLSGFGSLVTAPILGGSERTGAILMYSLRPAAYSSAQVELVERIGGEIGRAFAFYDGDFGVDRSRRPPGATLTSVANDHSWTWLSDFDISTAPRASRVSVIVVDRQSICRRGLDALFRNTSIRVEAEASTVLEAADLVRRYRPRAILYEMHHGDTVDIAPMLVDELAVEIPRVLILAEHASAPDVRAALKGGASGFLLKSVSPAGLISALYRTAFGGTVVDPDLLSGLVGLLTSAQFGTAPEERSKLLQLNERDRSILFKICAGRKSSEIAKSLGLSDGTVRNQLTSIYRTLGVRGRFQAASFALRAGMALDAVDIGSTRTDLP